jgi:hypothetical protein
MKKIFTVFVLVFSLLVAVGSLSLIAKEEVNQLGWHPFYKSRDLKQVDLIKIANEMADQVKAGFEKAGYAEIYDAFIEQLKEAKIDEIDIHPGDTIEWMLFKKKKQVEVKSDVVWTGKEHFKAYQFVIKREQNKDKFGYDEETFTFVVPKICGNISLKNKAMSHVDTTPLLPPNEPPTCALTVFPTRLFAGESVTLDASGSKDPEGKIVLVTFTISNDAGGVVEKKELNAKPYTYVTKLKAGNFNIKVSVKDDKGLTSKGNCEKSITVLKRGFIVGDIGILYQHDPAVFLPIRAGYMYKFSEKFSIMAEAGIAPVISGDDDTTAFIGDVTFQLWSSNMYFGAGTGIFHTSNKTRGDLIINTGMMVSPHFSLFLEGRVAFDEFDVISDFGRIGLGFRVLY